MSSRSLSLHDVAARLGVHYMTAYRYVRLGQLDATKRGSNWEVAPQALEAFLRRHRPGSADAGSGGTARSGTGDASVDWSARYEARLLAGDNVGAFAVLEAALVAGADLEALYLDVMAQALQRVGLRWAAGEIDVADEHLATVIVRQHLGRLSARLTRRGRARGTVLVGCAPGERHELGSAMVVALLRLAGFDGIDLGADVPAASFGLAAARADRLVAVGISTGSSGADDGVRAAVAEVRGSVPDVPVLVGGSGVQGPEHARSLGADHFAFDGRAAVRLLDELAPRRQRTPAATAPPGVEAVDEVLVEEAVPG